MASLSDTQINELKARFDALDSNQDGTLSREELRGLFDGLSEGVSEAQLDQLLQSVDLNGDGKVDFNEFLQAAAAGQL